MGRFFVGITGASGHAYAEALVRALVLSGHGVDLSITRAGALVIKHELGVEAGERGEKLQASLAGWLGEETAREVRVFLPEEVGAPPSSGTSLGSGAILCPCSMGTLGRVAAGFSSNLVERVADLEASEPRRYDGAGVGLPPSTQSDIGAGRLRSSPIWGPWLTTSRRSGSGTLR